MVSRTIWLGYISSLLLGTVLSTASLAQEMRASTTEGETQGLRLGQGTREEQAETEAQSAPSTAESAVSRQFQRRKLSATEISEAKKQALRRQLDETPSLLRQRPVVPTLYRGTNIYTVPAPLRDARGRPTHQSPATTTGFGTQQGVYQAAPTIPTEVGQNGDQIGREAGAMENQPTRSVSSNQLQGQASSIGEGARATATRAPNARLLTESQSAQGLTTRGQARGAVQTTGSISSARSASQPGSRLTPQPRPSGESQASASALAASQEQGKQNPRIDLQNPAASRQNQPMQIVDDAYSQTRRAPRQRSQDQGASASEDPYAPLGIRIGAMIYYPSIDMVASYNTNATQTPQAEGSIGGRVTPELRAVSDWARHELTTTLRGGYVAYATEDDVNRPTINWESNLRLDARRTTTIDIGTVYSLDRESVTNSALPSSITVRPLVQMAGLRAGITERINRLSLTARGSLEQTSYEGTRFSPTSYISGRERTFTTATAGLRVGYEVMPDVLPFVEAAVNQRTYEQKRDSLGVLRGSTGYAVRSGAMARLTGTLTGEAAIGYLTQSPDDPRFSEISGVTIDGNLTWNASALTTVRLTARSAVNESVSVNSPGYLTQELGLGVEHALQRHITVNAGVGYGLDKYEGINQTDHRYTAEAGVVYKLSREAQVRGNYRYEKRDSNAMGYDYAANIFEVGVKLQR